MREGIKLNFFVTEFEVNEENKLLETNFICDYDIEHTVIVRRCRSYSLLERFFEKNIRPPRFLA
jgi:hypothetical protein